MKRPYFTVAIPSKNRPDRLANAIRSVLNQSCADFEIIVCDNSDPGLDVGAEVVKQFDDARIRYIRTSGTLSMPDNWERAVADARGEWVGILTDRSVFKPHALETIQREVERTGVELAAWLTDHFGRDPAGRTFKPRRGTLKRIECSSESLLRYFLGGHPKASPKVIPRLMNAMCKRSVLDRIRASAVGRCCPPVCPDYTSGFLMLGHVDRVLIIDESLFVGCGPGNGSAFRLRGELANQFMRDLGMDWTDLVDRMPSQACFTHGLILNDFIRVRDTLPERYPGLNVDRVQYYLGCLYDYYRAAKRGADRTEDLDVLLSSLNNENELVQSEVRGRKLYLRSILVAPEAPVLPPGAEQREDQDEAGPAEGPTFDDVFQAIDWSMKNPIVPSEISFFEELPGLDQLPYWNPQRQPALSVAAE